MSARIVFSISGTLLLLAGALAWQAGLAFRGGERSVPNVALAASPMVAPAAAKTTPEPAASGQGEDADLSWTPFVEFTFDFDQATLQDPDREMVTRAAAYLAANPSARIGLDGRSDPHGNGLRNKNLMDRRVAAVRDALIGAGVPAERIEIGEFADPLAIRDREVAALLTTAAKAR